MTPSRVNAIAIALLTILPGASFADWSGGYVGLSAGAVPNTEVSLGEIFDPEDDFVDVDNVVSAFAGYQIQQGQLVLGGEIAIGQANNFAFDEDFGIPASDVRVIDVKARAGYDLGQTLVYAVAGFTQTELLESDLSDILEEDTSTGVNYGLGVDYKFNDQFVVGAEYLVRDVTTETFLNIDTKSDAFAVRASFNF